MDHWTKKNKKHPLWEDHLATWWSQWLPGCSYQSSQPAIASQKDAVLQGVRVSTKSCWAKFSKWWFMMIHVLQTDSCDKSEAWFTWIHRIWWSHYTLFINRMNGWMALRLQNHVWTEPWMALCQIASLHMTSWGRSGKVKLLHSLNAVSASFWSWGRNAWIHNGLGCWISWIHQEPLSIAYQTRDVQRISGIWGRAAPVKILKRAADSPQKLASTHSLFNLTPQPK